MDFMNGYNGQMQEFGMQGGQMPNNLYAQQGQMGMQMPGDMNAQMCQMNGRNPQMGYGTQAAMQMPTDMNVQAGQMNGMNPQMAMQMQNPQMQYNQQLQNPQMQYNQQLQNQQLQQMQAQQMQAQLQQMQLNQQMQMGSNVGARGSRVVTIPRVRLGMQYYMMYQGKKRVNKEDMIYELENICSEFIGKPVMRVNIEETPDIIRHICDNALHFLIRQEDAFSCNSNMVVPYYVCPYCGKMYVNKSSWE